MKQIVQSTHSEVFHACLEIQDIMRNNAFESAVFIIAFNTDNSNTFSLIAKIADEAIAVHALDDIAHDIAERKFTGKGAAWITVSGKTVKHFKHPAYTTSDLIATRLAIITKRLK